MNELPFPCRSTLYALSPIGIGTPDTESLLSYCCRLAAAHCITVSELIRKVTVTMAWPPRSEKGYSWFKSNINGCGDIASQWSHALSELTSVARLDTLTLVPWRNVISEQGLRAHPSRWCPGCFAQDRAEGRTSYFRLIWDIYTVDVCPSHGMQLTDVCQECERNDSRNSMSYVIPGWCTSCGAFLGDARPVVSPDAAGIWKASQIGAMLAAQSILNTPVCRDPMITGIRCLVAMLDDGKSAVFARRLGLNKSTVHYWLIQHGTPGIAAHLRIASQTGVPLANLLLGDVQAVQDPCVSAPSLSALFPGGKKRAAGHTRDWGRIKEQLEQLNGSAAPISVTEAARRLNLSARSLYLHTNESARAIGARWKEHNDHRGVESRERARKIIEEALTELMAEGSSANLRLLRDRIPKETMNSFGNVITLLREAKKRMREE